MKQKLTDFIISERNRFENRHNNLFAFSFGDIGRYYEFLEAIFTRYKIASKNFMDNINIRQELSKSFGQGSHVMTREEVDLLNKSVELTTILHLEIESFYLFAKILLDKVAHAIEFYFGQVRKMPLDSHDDLAKNFQEYISVKKLVINQELPEMISKLKTHISDYRDQKIAHEKSPRAVKATIFQADGKTRMSVTKMFPTEKDNKELEDDVKTKFTEDLKGEIDAYLSIIVDFIKENNQKTNLELENA
jgi:hypothetical protein